MLVLALDTTFAIVSPSESGNEFRLTRAEDGAITRTCTEAETELAEAVRDCVPSVEKVRLGLSTVAGESGTLAQRFVGTPVALVNVKARSAADNTAATALSGPATPTIRFR